jgi:mono/diheme cytochrome c family protein
MLFFRENGANCQNRSCRGDKTGRLTATEAVPVSTSETGGKGEALFKQYCIKCHKGGGNITNPEKTIRRKDLAANNINTPEDIVRIMRNPGKGMMKFSEEKILDDDSQKICEYILKTFD